MPEKSTKNLLKLESPRLNSKSGAFVLPIGLLQLSFG